MASDKEGNFLLMGVDSLVHDRRQKSSLTQYHAKPNRYDSGLISMTTISGGTERRIGNLEKPVPVVTNI